MCGAGKGAGAGPRVEVQVVAEWRFGVAIESNSNSTNLFELSLCEVPLSETVFVRAGVDGLVWLSRFRVTVAVDGTDEG